MSDERLREAERKWRETGAVEDEARYLLERVRVGDLTQERLELAAYCGHEGARRVAVQHAQLDQEGLKERTMRLEHRSKMAVVLGILQAVEPVWTAHDPRPGPIQEVVAAIIAWLRDPTSSAGVTRCRKAADSAHALAAPFGADPGNPARNVAFGAGKAAIACLMPQHADRAFVNLLLAAEDTWDDDFLERLQPVIVRAVLAGAC